MKNFLYYRYISETSISTLKHQRKCQLKKYEGNVFEYEMVSSLAHKRKMSETSCIRNREIPCQSKDHVFRIEITTFLFVLYQQW